MMLTILFSSKTLKTLETVVNQELKFLSNWLSLNADKTELILFRSNRRHLNLQKIYIKMDGKTLTPVNYVKYLGTYLDKNLTWDVHI